MKPAAPRPELIQLLTFNQEKAAGSACSRRVLEAINLVSTRTNEYAGVEVVLANDVMQQPVEAKRFQEPVYLDQGYNLELCVLPVEPDSNVTIRLGCYQTKTRRALELWQLVERDASSDRCSYAVFSPALDQPEGLDFGLIVTEAEEEQPFSLDESIKPLPLTNAKVLDSLMQSIRFPTGHSEYLGGQIQIEAIAKAYNLDLEASEGFQPPSYQGTLAKYITGMLAWRTYLDAPHTDANEPLIFENEYRLPSPNTVRAVITNEAIELEAEYHELGLEGRVAKIGTLHIRDEHLIQADDEQAGLTDDLVLLTNEVLGRPEIIVDTQLQQKIQEIISSSNDTNVASSAIRTLVIQYQKELSRSTVLDLGLIDLSRLQRPEHARTFLDEMHNIKVTISGARGLNVLERAKYVYDSAVYGAAHAFYNSGNLLNCAAIDVYSAFDHLTSSNYCFAAVTHRAFVEAFDISNCYAEVYSADPNAKRNRDIATQAFQEARSVDSSMAVGFDEAFWGGRRLTQCVTEFCDRSFKDKSDWDMYLDKRRYILNSAVRRPQINPHGALPIRSIFGKKHLTVTNRVLGHSNKRQFARRAQNPLPLPYPTAATELQ